MNAHDPIDPLRRRLWFLQQLDPDRAAYVTPAAVRLRGRLDLDVLAESVRELAARHAELLVGCVDRDGVPVLVTGSPPPLHRFSTPGHEVGRVCDSLLRTLATTLGGASFRAAVATLAPDDHVLLLALHQAAGTQTDAIRLLAELGTIYSGRVSRTPDPNGARAHQDTPPDAEWVGLLAATRPADCPADLPRPPVWQSAGATVPFTLPTALQLGELVPALLVLVHTVLARHSGRWSGVVGLRDGGPAVPVPLDLAPSLPFEQAVDRARDLASRSREVERPDSGQDLSRDPRFCVVAEVVHEVPADFGAPAVEPVAVSARITPHDLVVRLRQTADGGLRGELEYATALLSEDHALRLSAQLSELCARSAAHPATPLGLLDPLPPGERAILLPTSAPAASASPPVVAELIAAQRDRTPGAVAVEDGEQRLTYAELMSLATRLALHLRGLGVRRGDVVGVALPRGVELVASLIGVQLAGAAYVPFDPEHPAERLARALDDAGVRTLITAGSTFGSSAAPVLLTDLPAADPPGRADGLPVVAAEDAAYVIYTSGSTGRPKGVLVTHRALANLLWSMRERPGLAPGAVFPAVTTVSFDIAALELFLPLIVGGRVVVSGQGEAQDPERLAALLARSGAKVMQATPTTWRMLLESGWTPPAGFTALCGGERLPRELAVRLCESGVRLWDLYGPTETTVWSSVASLEDGVVRHFSSVANTTLYVLDERLEPAPLCAAGELYIGGDGVAAGYLGRQGRTAGHFVPDPYGGRAGARMYRTGDAARRHPDGRIEILGRTDDQLKIRGHRVEPGEIESVLAAHEGVLDAVVTATSAKSDAELQLVGYVRPVDGAEPPNEQELAEHCARLLPPYMVPARFAVVGAFPTTANGKVDRAALRVPPPTPTVGRPPGTHAERVVARVFAEVLDRQDVGARADFFALGGHSLLATRAISRLRTELGVELPVSALFEARTVEALAVRLAAADRALAPVTPAPRTKNLPLSFAQQRMWILHQLDPRSTAYHEPLAVSLPGPLDLDRLNSALSQVIERHEILRTRYARDEPAQIVEPPHPVRLAGEDGDVHDVLAEELARPFDLSAAPPVRVRLVRSADGTHTLLFVLHHIATDDRSHEVLAEELRSAYAGRPLPALPVQYADYAFWQRDLAAERGLGFWRERLKGLEPTELPPDRPRPAIRDARGDTVRFTVPAVLAERLAELGAHHRATPFMTLLAGFLATLARHTGQRDLAVGVAVSGRERPELDDLVGLFVNTVVMRTELADDATFSGFLRTVAQDTVETYRHADVPFERVVEVLAPHRDLSRNPLFSIMFAAHRTGSAVPDLPEAKFDLGCHLTDRPDGGLDGRIEYATGLYDRDTVARLCAHYVRLLEEVAAAADTSVREVRLGDAEEPAAIAPVPFAPVHRMLSTHAADAVAVSGVGRTLTYPELETEANRLAHRLRELGAGPGTLVVVRLPRSADLITALLGVLKSGAAYLPLDPGEPEERLAQAMRDADLVIASSAPEGARLLSLEDPAERELIRAMPATAPQVEVGADDLAYVVYTSGSTGRPKGAMITHGGLATYSLWASQALDAHEGSPLHTSIAYDLALTSLYPVLLAGGTVTLVPDGPAGVEPLAAALARKPYGLVKLTPTHLDLLASTGPPQAATRCLVVGGEQLRGEQLAAWAEHAPDTLVVNSYGPAETAVACSVHLMRAGEAAPGPVPIGRPIPGAAVHLLDDGMRPVPAGVAGEIYVGGGGVGRGYLGDPRLTADRFVPDPFAAQPGARLYRTGDLARRATGGELVFLGRRDQQVKIRGFRTEPGEIENVLTGHPAVRAAAVVVDRAEPGNPRLAAHVVADTGVSIAELRAHVAERLPAHQVPTLWAMPAELPLLGNGKLDRRSLPALAPLRSETHQPPVTPAEETIAEVWAGVLGVERVGRHDGFFALGGQSLLATRAALLLRERFTVPVSVRDLFSAQTVAQLAELLAGRTLAQVNAMFGAATATREEPAAAITRADRSRPLPLSFAQRSLWVTDQLDPGGTAYLVVTALRLRGKLDAERLSGALSQVVERHDILRTRYVAGGDGEPVQVVDQPAPLRLVAEEADPAEVLAQEGGTPIDLEKEPVLRARLVRLHQDEHVLVLTVHHIATDGWSAGIIADELDAAYRGEALPPLTVQYADFAAWQRERLRGPVIDGLLGYWRERLAGMEATELPTDRPRPAHRDFRGAALRFAVVPSVARRLDEIGRGAGATPFMTYLAAFLALLARYTGQTDLAVGVPASGRGDPAVDRLVGAFVNPIVLRADLAGAPSFSDLLGRVRESAVAAFLHAEAPFERLAEELAPGGDLSRHPLFQVLFAFREEGEERFRLQGLDVTPEPVPGRTAKFDLTVELTRRQDGGLTGEVEFACALFDRSTAERLAGHFVTLLAAAAAAPLTPIDQLELYGEQERNALARGWNGQSRPRPEEGLPELVSRQATLTPQAVAVRHDGHDMTYGELDAAANRFAHHLRASGVGADDVVGVCLPRRPDLVVALLGVLRAGAAFLPLDPVHPADRLAWMLDDAGARLVVVAAEPGPQGGTPVLSLAAQRAAIDARPGDHAPAVSDPDALVYVIYTSGSTGRPKGVAVPHRGIRNRVLWAVERFGLNQDDRLLQKTAITFDACVWEFFGPLVSGGTVVLPPDGTERDPALLTDVAAREGITVLQGVPSFFRSLAEEPGLGSCRSLRLIFSAGEPLPAELAARMRAALPQAELVNTYGPTECSIDVTAWRVEPGKGTVPIGLPLDNTRAVVRDSGGLAPIGAPGELLVAGEGLARGYLGRPRLTAERFVPDPYGPPGARCYLTGDIVRRRADGVLEFVGRADRQVKIRGVRIELGEVEAVLAAHDAVAASAVEARQGPDGLPRLVAYVVPRSGEVRVAELRAFLLARLPEPYVPSVFVPLDSLPYTSSGKIDRAALPEPVDLPGHGGMAPRTPAEKQVAEIMAAVLGVGAVGVEDDFFDLGGHSLLAIRIAGRLRAAFGVAVPVREVFERRTAAALAAFVTKAAGRLGEAIARVAEGTPVPLSYAQRRLWFLDLLGPGSSRYHVTWAMRLSGRLDTAALSRALTALFARHGALRTRYETGSGGDPVQVVQPVEPVSPQIVEAAQERLPELVGELAGRPFDLAARPPVAPYLIRLGHDEHAFVLVMHHIACDGWSERVMAAELAELYGGGEPGPVPLQYTDYTAWQRGHLTGDLVRRELDHWRGRLAGLQPLDLPADRPRPHLRDGRGAALAFTVPPEVARPLLALGRRQGATAFMTFLSVFGALLSRYTGAADLAVGAPSAGRGRQELEDVVGFFVNTVVLRLDLDGDPTPEALVRRVRDVVLDAFSHDELPFELLVEELAPAREADRAPLVNVLFEVQETPQEPLRLAGLDVRPIPVVRTTAKFDLTCTLVADADGGYRGELEYATALFSEAAMVRLAGHFRTLAASMAAAADRPVGELEMLEPGERRQLLHEWNEAAAAPAGECLHEAFAARVARDPDAVAVVGQGERLTYADVAERAQTLARRLVAAGVRPESPVATFLERTPSAVVVLLAVSQAGGVYVPLGTAQPAGRLAVMLDDLRPAVIVTEERLLSQLGEAPVPVLLADTQEQAPAVELPQGDPDRLAYMIYTSGSTGRPKAVMVPHRAYTHHCRVIAQVNRVQPHDRAVLLSALTFDLAMEQLSAILLAGGTLVVSDAHRFWAPFEVPDRFADEGITHVFFTPAYYREVMDGVRPGDPRFAKLRLVHVGGEAATYDDARRWFAAGMDGDFVCSYGPTETTIISVTYPVPPREAAEALPESTLPIGRPVPGTRAYVLDGALNPVPVGMVGELCIGGERVSRGYLRRPGLTADRFVPDPYGGRPGERLYRTGDYVRYRADGVIEYLGRMDTQVKVRGFRIELGEIEAALNGHPDVRAAAVAVREPAPGDRRLVGYVVPREGAEVSPARLRAHLRERVPDYMVPGVWMTLGELPLNASKKVDRQALPTPDSETATGPDELVAPRTEVEEAIAAAWAAVLGVGSVGVEHDFFDLGGHSLLATRLQVRLRDLFGLDVPLRLLFEATTVRAQATALERLAEAVPTT